MKEVTEVRRNVEFFSESVEQPQRRLSDVELALIAFLKIKDAVDKAFEDLNRNVSDVDGSP